MKNLYELTSKEKDTYRDEFNKLPFTKKINKERFPAILLAFFGILTCGFLDGLMEDSGYKLQDITDTIGFISILSLVTFVALSIYLHFSFIRWMKIKHDIEY